MAYGLFQQAARTEDGLKSWIDEWVINCKNRNAYIDHYTQNIGSARLNNLKAKSYYSAPANYGSAYTTPWNEEGKERYMGVTLEELETTMKERGLFYE